MIKRLAIILILLFPAFLFSQKVNAQGVSIVTVTKVLETGYNYKLEQLSDGTNKWTGISDFNYTWNGTSLYNKTAYDQAVNDTAYLTALHKNDPSSGSKLLYTNMSADIQNFVKQPVQVITSPKLDFGLLVQDLTDKAKQNLDPKYGQLVDSAWVFGIPDPGTIILPSDRYLKVLYFEGTNDAPTVTELTTDSSKRPYYEIKNGSTYVYVDHFSGAGGTKLVSIETGDDSETNIVAGSINAQTWSQTTGDGYIIKSADIKIWRTGVGASFPVQITGVQADGLTPDTGTIISSNASFDATNITTVTPGQFYDVTFPTQGTALSSVNYTLRIDGATVANAIRWRANSLNPYSGGIFVFNDTSFFWAYDLLCQIWGDPVPGAPTVSSDSSSNITYTSATLSGNVTASSGNITDYGFEYGTTLGGPYTFTTNTTGAFVAPIYYANDISSLTANTTYYWRAKASNEDVPGVYGYGSERSFTTNAYSIPTVSTGASSNITGTSATIDTTITSTDGINSTEIGVQYGLNASYGYSVNSTGTYADGTYMSFPISGLSLNTTYHWRGYAINTAGIGYGNDATFLTNSTPSMNTVSATTVTATQESLTGNITNTNGSNSTIRGFWVSSTPGSIHDIASVNTTGSYGVGEYSITITGLSPSTQYWWNAYSINGEGLGVSDESDFTTQNITAPTVLTELTTNINYTSVTLGGNVTSLGGDEDVNETGFEYGTVSGIYNVSINTSWPDLTKGLGSFSMDTGSVLSQNTTYYFKAYALNEGGYGFSAEGSFNTLAYAVPNVTSEAATGILDTTATLNGTIDITGGINPTQWTFMWDTTSHAADVTLYPNTFSTNGSFPVGSYSYAIPILTQNTTYFFRFSAEGFLGRAYGVELSFKTLTGIIHAPTNLVIKNENGNDTTANITFTLGLNSSNTLVLGKTGSYPVDRNDPDAYQVYFGPATQVDDVGLNLALNTKYYRLWGEDSGSYSADFVQGTIGGAGLAGIAGGIVIFVLVLITGAMAFLGTKTRSLLMLVSSAISVVAVFLWIVNPSNQSTNPSSPWVITEALALFGFMCSLLLLIANGKIRHGVVEEKENEDYRTQLHKRFKKDGIL